ncbi:hypothetical protein MRX96_039000 [Rhipicephalus microplus]
MALNAATDQQYHLLDQDGTADDQMDQLQGDHDTRNGYYLRYVVQSRNRIIIETDGKLIVFYTVVLLCLCSTP